ncbi:hypothetical protein HPB50_003112 [Hyalomma asiaticum]|uniref:Uncharacterized protein n=1 Tax=Hyalomma asiaticum TaxID=266040 RepID=A0ACB7TBX8_HYAAI|nr:hypothetical protein HPB50_003112 [Hyalomma asiaticum]
MADHSELVTEMSVVEKMSTQERLKHAKKRRQQQLKKWSQHERELQKAKKGKASSPAAAPLPTEYKVHFVPSVMLLEAAARNDVDEGRYPLFSRFTICRDLAGGYWRRPTLSEGSRVPCTASLEPRNTWCDEHRLTRVMARVLVDSLRGALD